MDGGMEVLMPVKNNINSFAFLLNELFITKLLSYITYRIGYIIEYR
jgi:hypothetical protein